METTSYLLQHSGVMDELILDSCNRNHSGAFNIFCVPMGVCRCFGDTFAEIAWMATRKAYRQQGNCRALFEVDGNCTLYGQDLKLGT